MTRRRKLVCRREFTSRFVFVGTGFSRDFHWFWEKGFNNLYSRFYRVGDGNQREAAADLSLDSLGAPEDHT